MHQAYTTFSAPIVSSRPPISSHYAPYNPRTSPQTTTTTTSRTSTTEFKGSTNPSEDWTKISDLAERRRIQNRIAQRNYRKKLKRRLEDLERRAQSRSISPNGEDTASDGRSTRESSTEQPLSSGAVGTSNAITSTAATIEAAPVTTPYDYTTPAYTTSSSSTPYPSQYRSAAAAAANSMAAYSSSAASSTTYVSAPLDYSQAPSTSYLYAPYDHTQTTQTDLSVIDPSFILPHPSSSRIPGVMRTGGMYDVDNTASSINPYFLSNSYELQDPYFPAGGVSSSYYNLDHFNPLPPLLNTHTASHYSTSQRN